MAPRGGLKAGVSGPLTVLLAWSLGCDGMQGKGLICIAHPVAEHLPCQPHQISLPLRVLGHILHLTCAFMIKQQRWQVGGKFHQGKAPVSQNSEVGFSDRSAQHILPNRRHLGVAKVQF